MNSPRSDEKPKTKISWVDFVLTGIGPLLIGNTLILWFGVKYSDESGEGYGYGLLFGFLVTIGTFARFLYKYRNYED